MKYMDPDNFIGQIAKSLLFSSMSFSKIMSRTRFETILKFLKLSAADDEDQQVLDFVAAVKKSFQKSLISGSFINIDESIIKSFYRNLKGKVKIIRKPRPNGNELKNLADGTSEIVFKL